MISTVDSSNHPVSGGSGAKPNGAWTVVVSKGQSRNPEKRNREAAIADLAGQIPGVNVMVVPHLYDLPKTSETFERLGELESNLVVFSWIYGRAAHWVLDRNGVQGQTGEVLLGQDESDLDGPEDPTAQESPDGDTDQRVTELYPRPDRMIHCIDLKSSEAVGDFQDEMHRILGLLQAPAPNDLPIVSGQVAQIDETTGRRWYPVIDFDRCTNCMECIDFCLFGVYGVDGTENILVEQPDNCRKGCPACSRVCPANAIIFPQHKAPAIAGATTDGDEGFKIDLSQLFGAPKEGADPIATAARERDEQLLLAGRDARGIDDQLQRRQSELSQRPKDRLDDLIDSLEELDL